MNGASRSENQKKTWKFGGRICEANLISCQEMYLAGQSKSAMTLGLMQPLAAIEMGLNLIEPTTQKDHHLGVLDLRPVPGTYRLDGLDGQSCSSICYRTNLDGFRGETVHILIQFWQIFAFLHYIIKNRVLQTFMTHQICRRARFHDPDSGC